MEEVAADILQILSPENIDRLLQELRNELPDSVVVYQWITTYRDWQAADDKLQVQLMCPAGDWRGATVIAVTSGLIEDGLCSGVVYAKKENGEQLKQAVMKTQMIPWTKMLYFAGVLTRHETILRDAAEIHGIQVPNLVPCKLHYLPAEQAVSLVLPRVPDDVRLRPLRSEDLDVVCANWPHYNPLLRRKVHAMINHNPSVGVYVENHLAAMVLQADYGGIGLLQTVPEFRRRGFAALAMVNQAKTLGEAGISPHFHVISDNHGALKLFSKLGFPVVGETNWLLIKND